jgi:hypothetical protein
MGYMWVKMTSIRETTLLVFFWYELGGWDDPVLLSLPPSGSRSCLPTRGGFHEISINPTRATTRDRPYHGRTSLECGFIACLGRSLVVTLFRLQTSFPYEQNYDVLDTPEHERNDMLRQWGKAVWRIWEAEHTKVAAFGHERLTV